jgi:hypothetical protein
MGPIQLRIEEGNLYHAWEKSRFAQIEDHKSDVQGQQKFVETFLCRPPNVLLFQLNRVSYDIAKQKLVKDHRRFDFEQTIYCDYFLSENKERSKAHRKELNQLKTSLN